MAYARFSDGDVYVFYNANGYLECCGCFLGPSFWTQSVAELEEHLRRHVEAGYRVGLDRIMRWVHEDFPSGSTRTIDELIAASSLGAPEVVAVREQTPDSVSSAIVDRAMSAAPGYHRLTPRWAQRWTGRVARRLADYLALISKAVGQ